MATQLATVDDLAGRLGRDLTGDEATQADLLLTDVSAAVRAYTGQEFTAATTTARLRVKRGYVRLPQRPVNDVTAVVDVDGNDVTFTWHAGDRVAISSAVPDAWAWEPRTTALEYVDVTYSHGSDTVPDAIVAIVCQIAGRALGQPADSTGIQQESIDDYSYTIGPAAASGAFGLLGDERAALDRYVRVGATARVGL